MAKEKQTKSKQLPSKINRPPVVAVLGHVDHGKTSLLDYIRKSHVAEKEFGGITQHMGSYQIEHENRKITFIDTPGHEAFSAMRARGGQASDIAILVVAADDGVMPQTKESIAHIKAANIPFLVAINKIDLPGANIEKVKKQLAENAVLLEGYGGDVVAVKISAKTGQGITELLEMLLLLADMQELEDTQYKPFSGIVIEAKMDKACGPSARIIVKEGILRVGDSISTESASGKARSLFDSNKKNLKEALPAAPVEVLGFSKVPKVGETVKKSTQEKDLDEKIPNRLSVKEKLALPENEICLIIKADYVGSLEAIISTIEQLRGENKQLKIFFSETGAITEGDVLLASATHSLIIGFNVDISPAVEKLAGEEKVLIRRYNLIYELLDELRQGLEALKREKSEENSLGEAEVLESFATKVGKIAGCKVKSGRINQGDILIVKRGEKELGRSKIVSMKHRETNINEASEGQDFGVVLEKELPFIKGDIMIAIGH